MEAKTAREFYDQALETDVTIGSVQLMQEYADHVSTSQKEAIERLGMAIQNLYDAAFTAVSHVAVANYQSREIEAKNLIRTAYEQAEQLLSTTEP